MWETKYRIVKKTRKNNVRGKKYWERTTYRVQSRLAWWPLWIVKHYYAFGRLRYDYDTLLEAKQRIKELKSTCGEKIRSESKVIHTE